MAAISKRGRKNEGRPTVYNKELGDLICQKLAEGISLRTICLDEELPDASTVFRWLRTDDEFCKQYVRAKEESADALIEDLQEIGDKAIVHAEEADFKASNAVVSAYKLKADNIKWAASKLKPKKYGDKLDLTSGGDKLPTPIIPLNVPGNNSDQKDNGAH